MTSRVNNARVRELLKRMQNGWQRDKAQADILRLGAGAAPHLARLANVKALSQHACHTLCLMAVTQPSEEVKAALGDVLSNGTKDAQRTLEFYMALVQSAAADMIRGAM